MPTPAVTSAGIRAVLSLPENASVDWTLHVSAGARRLKQLIGSTNYAAVLADTLTSDELDAAIQAGALLGASSYLSTLQPAASSRGMAMTITRADGGTETFASAEQVAVASRQLRDRAIQALIEADLYERPASVNLTRIDVDEDDA